MQESKGFKYCKYCKMSDHFIDTCPEILCKKCNERGHPHWKCVKKRNVGLAFDDHSSVFMEVVEEEEVKPKTLTKVISANTFELLIPDEDEMFDSNSIFHFLQYKDTCWADL